MYFVNAINGSVFQEVEKQIQEEYSKRKKAAEAEAEAHPRVSKHEQYENSYEWFSDMMTHLHKHYDMGRRTTYSVSSCFMSDL